MPSYSRKVQLPGKKASEIYVFVEGHIDGLLQRFSMTKFEVRKDPNGRTISFDSSMFSATLVCLEGAVNLEGKLSLMAMPFRSKIDEGIDRFLSKFKA